MTKLLAFLLAFMLYADAANAAPVVAAIGSFASWLGGAFAAGGIGGFMANLLGGTALSLLQMQYEKNKMKGQKEPGISTQSTTTGGNVAQSFILGRSATNGHLEAPMMTYQTDGNPNEWLVYVISLGDLPITSLDRIIINDKSYAFATSPVAEGTGLGATVVDDELADKVWVRFHDGHQEAADGYLRQVFGDYPERPWTSDMVLKGIPYVVITFKGRSKDNLWSGFPVVRFEVKGMKLYDPRDGSQQWGDPSTWKYTDNLAVMAYNILAGITMNTGDIWGMQAQSFMLARCISAMNVCDEAIPVQGGGTRPRYRGGIEVFVDQEPSDILDEIVKGFSGMYADEGGTWTIRAGAFDPPELSLTDANILISQSTSFTPFRGLTSTHNAISGSYPEPAALWNAKEAVPIYNLAWEMEDRRRLPMQYNLPVVWDGRQARAVMSEAIKDNRRQRVHSIALPRNACGYPLGAIFRWSSLFNRYGNKMFEVTDKVVNPLTLSTEYLIREVDPTDYDPDIGRDSVLPSVPSPTPVVPVLRGVFGWDATAITVEGDTGVRPGILLVWDPEIGADGVSWSIRHVSTGEIVNSGTNINVSTGRQVVTAGLLPSTQYHVTGKMVMKRRTLETAVKLVTTTDARIGLEELPQSILDDLRDLEDWVTNDGALILDDLAALEQFSNQLAATVETNRSTLQGQVDTVKQDLLDGLSDANAYTDSAIDQYDIIVQGQVESLVGQIEQLTAALTSDNLITNGEFIGNTNPWALTAATRVTRTGATNPLILAAPAEAMVQIGDNVTGNITQAINSFEVTANDRFQIRFSAAISVATRTLQINVVWRDAGGVAIGSQENYNLTLTPANQWKVYSVQMDPPDNAVGANITFRKTQAGTPIFLTKLEASTVNIEIEARITSLEAARVTLEDSLALLSTSVTTRFSLANGRIDTEISNRSAADQVIVGRLDTLETQYGTQSARIDAQDTLITSATEAIADMRLTLDSTYGRTQLVQDPEFEAYFLRWRGPATTIPSNLVSRDIGSASIIFSEMPGRRAYRLVWNSDQANTLFTPMYEVQRSDQVVMSYAYFCQVNAAPGLVWLQFFDANQQPVDGFFSHAPADRGKWTRFASEPIDVPAGAKFARILVAYGQTPGTANSTFFTDFRLQRLVGYDWLSNAQIKEVKSTQSDANGAFAQYKIDMGVALGNLDGRIIANANNISQRYTKAETNQAISTSVNALKAILEPQIGNKAEASALNGLSTKVNNIDGRLTAQSTSIQTVDARVNRTSAVGRMVMQAHATGAGSSVRLGMHVRASEEDSLSTAGFFMEALSNGEGRIAFQANRFAIVSDSAANPASRVVPFYVNGGVVYIDTARIREASIDTLHLASGAVVGAYTFVLQGDQPTLQTAEVARFVINLPESGYRGLIFSYCTDIVRRDKQFGLSAQAFIQVNGATVRQSTSSVNTDKESSSFLAETVSKVDGVGRANFVAGNNVVRLMGVNIRDNVNAGVGVRYAMDVLIFKR